MADACQGSAPAATGGAKKGAQVIAPAAASDDDGALSATAAWDPAPLLGGDDGGGSNGGGLPPGVAAGDADKNENDVAVFCCGPEGLVRRVRESCAGRARTSFHAELFYL